MDGNNSLKLVDSTFRSGSVRTDNRVTSSKRWISPDDVDMFKDEVNKKVLVRYHFPIRLLSNIHVQPEKGPSPLTSAPVPAPNAPVGIVPEATDPIIDTLPEADVDPEDIAWLNVTEIDELAQCVNTCVERWRNAGPEARKKMFALFAVSGVFLAVCRHGHVLVICDMIRSGELYVSSSLHYNCIISPFLQDEVPACHC